MFSLSVMLQVADMTVGRAGSCIVHVPFDSLPMARALSTLSLHVASSPKLEHRQNTRMSMSYSEPRFLSDNP